MRCVDAATAAKAVAAHSSTPRVVVSGNSATPWLTLAALDAELATWRVWVLNAQPGIPDRDGVTLETCFVGPGMRGSPRLRYLPARLSLVPVLFRDSLRPDAVLAHVSRVVDGKVSLGAEVNVMPAAIAECRAAGGVVIGQVNEHMPYTFGDGEMSVDDFDYLVDAAQPLVLNLDGEPVQARRFDIECIPGRLRMHLPARSPLLREGSHRARSSG